jgi:hypothetical protein
MKLNICFAAVAAASLLASTRAPAALAADEDDIVYLRPEHNPYHVKGGEADAIFVVCDGEPVSCSTFRTLLYNDPALAAGDFDHDGIKDYWDPDDDNAALPFELLKLAAGNGAGALELRALHGALAESRATTVKVIDVDDVWPADACAADLDDLIWAAHWLYSYAASFMLPDGTKITAKATSTSAGLLLVLTGAQASDAYFLAGPLACAE